MNLLNRFKATCPHCQYRFWQFQTCKGIKFCPSCHNSFIETVVKHNKSNSSKRGMIIVSTLVFILSYALQRWQEHPAVLAFADIFIYLVGFALIFTLLLTLLSLTVFRNGLTGFQSIVAGIDQLNDVKEDLGEYRLDGVNVIECLNCGSQRLQSHYWYRTNLAKKHPEISAPKATDTDFMTDTFVGCLHCKACYQNRKQKINAAQIITVAMLIFLLVMSKSDAATLLASQIAAYLSLSTVEAIYIAKAILLSLWIYFVFRLLSSVHVNVNLGLKAIK